MNVFTAPQNVDSMIMKSKEIERKFLVKNDNWKKVLSKKHPPMIISHAYIVNQDDVSIRVQVREREALDEQKAAINIKVPPRGLVRNETELPMDWFDGVQLIASLQGHVPIIAKVRSFVDYTEDGTLYWEIDEFKTYGIEHLVLAELEIPYCDFEIVLPEWIGEEVTDNPEFYGTQIAMRI